MPDISKIRLVLNQEDETFELKDSELRDALDILLGKDQDSEEDNNQGD